MLDCSAEMRAVQEAVSGVSMSDAFKLLLVVFVGAFMPVSAWSFLSIRRQKKEKEFARVVGLLDIARDVAEFARDRVTEQYAQRDYLLPVLFCWFLSVLGLVSLLFGAQLVDDHYGRSNLLLTGLYAAVDCDAMQQMRVQGMVMLSISFLGSFFWSVRNIIKRLSAGDLAPAVYFNASTRIVVAPIIALIAGHLSVALGADPASNLGAMVVAFLIGFFPDEALEYLKEHSPVPMFKSSDSADELPLAMIEGMTIYDRTRLGELGIDNAQNLAVADFVELMIRTPYNPAMLIDWIGQARLYVYFKDEVTKLRANQVRTIFDLVSLSQSTEDAADLAETTAIDAQRLQWVATSAADDPTVMQLLHYRDGLHRVTNETTPQPA